MYHFVKEIFKENKILLKKITIENPANMMIRVMITIKFNQCLNLINILQVWTPSGGSREHIWRHF